MKAYIYLKSTGEVVAKIDEESEENFNLSLANAIANDDYDFRLEMREGETK